MTRIWPSGSWASSLCWSRGRERREGAFRCFWLAATKKYGDGLERAKTIKDLVRCILSMSFVKRKRVQDGTLDDVS